MTDTDTFVAIFWAIVLALFLVGGWLTAPYRCQAQFPDMQTQWTFWGGCQVKTQQGWIPSKNYRVM